MIGPAPSGDHAERDTRRPPRPSWRGRDAPRDSRRPPDTETRLDHPTELTDLYDREERQRAFPAGPDAHLAWDGPVFRLTGAGPAPWENGVLYVRREARQGDALAACVARQVAHFAARGHGFEWKVASHDRTPELPRVLAAHGLAPETSETVVVLSADHPFPARPLPPGVVIEAVADDAGLHEVGVLNERVNGNADHAAWLVRSLADELVEAPGELHVFVARHAGEVVSAGWVRTPQGTSFASLWGGSTLAGWRRRGLYAALVARRIEVAHASGHAHVTVDCGPESLPILLARGFTPLTRVTPWIRPEPERRATD